MQGARRKIFSDDTEAAVRGGIEHPLMLDDFAPRCASRLSKSGTNSAAPPNFLFHIFDSMAKTSPLLRFQKINK